MTTSPRVELNSAVRLAGGALVCGMLGRLSSNWLSERFLGPARDLDSKQAGP